MMTTRTLKTIGASLAASTLLLVAGCSSDEQASPETSATNTQSDTRAQQDSSDSATPAESGTETAEDVDFLTLLEGITYKGEQITALPPDAIEEYAQALKVIESEDAFESDSPGCAEAFKNSKFLLSPEKISPQTVTIAGLDTDEISVAAFHRSATKDPTGDQLDLDLSKCRNVTAHSPSVTSSAEIEHLPLNANAEKGYAIIMRGDADGQPKEAYSTLAEKNGTLVNIDISAPTEENIAAAEETMTMILERL